MSVAGFIGRWSRLKRQGRPADDPGGGVADPAEPASAASPSGSTAAQDPGERTDEDPDKATLDLPDVDTLTAQSDITAFLRENVPRAIKAAALRRAWSVDPAIRDFTGPVEMDWDFNDPGSIPGFGGGGNPASVAAPALRNDGNRTGQPESAQHDRDAATKPARAGPDTSASAEPPSAPPEPTDRRPLDHPGEDRPPSQNVANATPAESASPATSKPTRRGKRHGTATPS